MKPRETDAGVGSAERRPAASFPVATACGPAAPRQTNAVIRAASLFWFALREIFDEAAYARFLTRRHMVPSAESYAAFRRENEQARARRARCC